MFLFSLLVNSKGTVCFSVSPARAHVRALVSGYAPAPPTHTRTNDYYTDLLRLHLINLHSFHESA